MLSFERDELVNQGLGSDLIDMFVNNTALTAHVVGADVPWTYTPKGGIDFTAAAVKRIVEEYFRDDGELSTVATIDGVPLAQIYGRGQNDWSMRLTSADDYEDRRVNLDIDGDGEIYVNDIERAYVEWAAAYDAGLIRMDYEDWMKTYGVSSVLPNNVS